MTANTHAPAARKSTPAERKAQAAYRKRRKERGDRLVGVWMTADKQDELEYLCSLRKQNQADVVGAALSALNAITPR